jgi:uncharacterized membrane protein YgcG
VLGEFYWQLTREQRTLNTDYQSGSKRLNREQTGDEIVWSAGDAMSADDVMKAFRLAGDRRAALQRDVLPSSGSGGLLAKLFVAMFVIAVLLMLFRCSSGSSSSNCDGLRTTYGENSQEYASCLNSNRSGGGSGFRTGGGSFGGFSSGGGHK